MVQTKVENSSIQLAAASSIRKIWGDLIYNVKAYGAIGDGSHDDTTKIQAAINAAPHGAWVYFPPGNYLISGTITINKRIKFSGGGRNTVIVTNHPTAHMIDVTEWFVNIESLYLDSSVTRTAGYAIRHAGGAYLRGKSLFIANQYDGVYISGVLDQLDDVEFRDFKHNGILVQGGGDQAFSHIVMDNTVQPSGAGIRCEGTAAMFLSDCDIIRANICLLLAPTAPGVYAVYATNCYFDSSNYGAVFEGTSDVMRCKFTNCWFSSHTVNGVKLNNTLISGIDFVNCDIYGNGSDGVLALFGDFWGFSNCRIAGNALSGFAISSGCDNFQIVNNTIGLNGGFGSNQYGVFIQPGEYGKINISENIFSTNTIGNLIDGSTNCVSKRIQDNQGANPYGPITSPAMPLSGVSVKNTLGYPVSVYIVGGTVSAIDIRGTATGLTSGQIVLAPDELITIQYTAAPSWKWFGL